MLIPASIPSGVNAVLAVDASVAAQTRSDLTAITGKIRPNTAGAVRTNKRSVTTTSTLSRPSVPRTTHRRHTSSLQSFYDEWGAPPTLNSEPLLTTSLLHKKQPSTASLRVRRMMTHNQLTVLSQDVTATNGSAEIAGALVSLPTGAVAKARPSAYPARWSIADRSQSAVSSTTAAGTSSEYLDLERIHQHTAPSSARKPVEPPASINLLFHRRISPPKPEFTNSNH
jgi:hypothetical protein